MAGNTSVTELATAETLLPAFPAAPIVKRRAPAPAGVSLKDLDLIMPRVMERAPECPEPTALRYLRDAAIEFCRRTRIWRESFVAELFNDSEPVIHPYDQAQTYEITSAFYFEPGEDPETCKGRKLEAAAVDWLDNECPGWRVECACPRFVTQATPKTVIVTPWAKGTVRLELVLIPTETATQVPAILVEAYAKEIADGALGTVMALPRPWRDPGLAMMYAAGFQASLDRFAARVPKGQQRARPRTTRGSFF